MPISIVSSSSALTTQTSLRNTTDKITSSIAKLSSGQRVFSAEEDATALGVGSGMSIEIAGLRSAAINTSTGISMLQIAEGSLGDIQDIVQRMKTLATQSSSGQLSDSERVLLQQEYASLASEVERIANDTEFNGQSLLSGDGLYDVDYAHVIQADGLGSIQVDSGTVTSDATFRYEYNYTRWDPVAMTNDVVEELTLYRIEGGTTTSQVVDLTALLDAVAGVGQDLTATETVNVNFNSLGITLTLDDAFTRGQNILPTVTDNSGADITLTPLDPNVSPLAHEKMNVSSEAIDAFVALDASSAFSQTTGILTVPIITNGTTVTLGGVAGIRYDVNSGGVGADGAASANLVGSNTVVDIYITTASGSEHISTLTYDTIATGGTTDGTLDLNIAQGLFDADYTAGAGDLSLEFMVGFGATPAQDFVTTTLQPATLSALGLTTNDVTTQVNAELAMVALDNAISTLSQMRSQLGADQSRLEFVSNRLLADIENLESARSALLDTDVSAELTELTSNQTLAEVAVAMLQRVNQEPERLLQLLQN